jgi:two-component system KDP operon response regulator KdpE
LIVEDEPDVAQTVGDMLDGCGKIEIAGTALEAIQQVSTNPPDLAVVDVGLPDGDGVALAKTIGIPVILMTARGSFDSIHDCPNVKFVLFKPISATTLIKTVREVLPSVVVS